MSLEEQIHANMIEAMKKKDALRVSTLRLLIAEIKKTKIDKLKDKLDDPETTAILKKQIKQRQDSIEQFEKAGRNELSEKENSELKIIKEYLPEELPPEELLKIVEEVIQETGASSVKEMGRVMKGVLDKAAGRADNKQVSELVKQKLGS